ncbi:type II toxin-antitoxin system Phd/YefM family antitoxin [Streptomyces rhizosphaericola]|uniref:type II toxin-antitoxin system Phd/YefM family antitoxin n=1 Tax=Streptomyces TaxID=1883 RepID=UPI000ADA5329|nr:MULTISPECIES: type II toxin-antitoxin system Phd/YefM family antitoxin [unclassified Streptomyces]
MSLAAGEARKKLFPLIKNGNENHEAIEIVSKHGNAVLVRAEDYVALREGSYLLRSPANAWRLLKAYENALSRILARTWTTVMNAACSSRDPLFFPTFTLCRNILQ